MVEGIVKNKKALKNPHSIRHRVKFAWGPLEIDLDYTSRMNAILAYCFFLILFFNSFFVFFFCFLVFLFVFFFILPFSFSSILILIECVCILNAHDYSIFRFQNISKSAL